MSEFGLDGWEFKFTKAKRICGQCCGKSKTIKLSIHHLFNSSTDDVDDTIKHEIAHAIAPPGAGHGPDWKRACAITGAKPIRCGEEFYSEHRYEAICSGCGQVFTRHRKTRQFRTYWCPKCLRPQGLLTFRKVR